MADTVAAVSVYDGPGEIVMRFINISDGTGEAAVLKVDVSTLNPSASEVSIHKIVFSTVGMGVDVLWDATTDVLAWHVPADQSGELCFKDHPIKNTAGAGKTGDVMFTTVGHSANDRYSIQLHMRKRTA